jgi:hypothetical protein
VVEAFSTNVPIRHKPGELDTKVSVRKIEFKASRFSDDIACSNYPFDDSFISRAVQRAGTYPGLFTNPHQPNCFVNNRGYFGLIRSRKVSPRMKNVDKSNGVLAMTSNVWHAKLIYYIPIDKLA